MAHNKEPRGCSELLEIRSNINTGQMENEISKVEPCSEMEAEALPGLCEIRFDALVRMYDMGFDKTKSPLPIRIRMEVPRKPQWFKNSQTMTLHAIRNGDEYSIGRMIKEQFRQLELHIEQYEKFGRL
jgi:hypothetical protein